MRRFTDAGSVVGRVIFVLAVVTAAFLVFVLLKYVFLDGEGGSPDPAVTVTATSSPALSPSAKPSPVATPISFGGNWTGHVTGDLNTYDIEVAIVDDGTTLTGSVTYTWNPPRAGVADCKGTWTQTSRRDRHVEIRETITSGGACVGEVDITLDLRANGTIAFAIDYSDVYHPKATLTREG